MIASRTLQRANTIPEMALVLSLVMLTLFGIFQYALVGFNQIGSDGAAFVGDHAAVAQYGAPTSSNGAYAQQVGLVSFPHANAAFSAQIPKNMTYETDVVATHKTIGFAQLFPATTQSYSRIIEPSQSVQPSKGGQCATALENITYNGTTPVLNSPKVALLGNVPTDQIYQQISTSSGTALALNLGLLNSDGSTNGLLIGVSQNFSQTVSQLAAVNLALDAVPSLPNLGNGLSKAISTQIAPLVASATGGTGGTGGTNGAGATISLQPPLTPAQFTTQVGLATTAITQIEAGSGVLGGVTNVLFKPLNQALFGTGTLSTVLPPGGLLGPTTTGLTTLNTLEGNLYALNQTTSCV